MTNLEKCRIIVHNWCFLFIVYMVSICGIMNHLSGVKLIIQFVTVIYVREDSDRWATTRVAALDCFELKRLFYSLSCIFDRFYNLTKKQLIGIFFLKFLRTQPKCPLKNCNQYMRENSDSAKRNFSHWPSFITMYTMMNIKGILKELATNIPHLHIFALYCYSILFFFFDDGYYVYEER